MRATPAGLRFLFVGQLVTHKNVGVAMRAMEDVRRSLPQAQLFLTGPPKHEYPPVEGVTYLGFVPDSALREAYRLASALVMPSLHETVGLPMLEAMDAGTPVLAADRAYAHDVCEDAALFFDPLDARDLAGALVEVARDQAMRRELVARGCALVARRRAAQPYRRLVSAALEAVS
jgi:glycosyltransferase involved in cell wall biosynthesis